MRKHLLFVLTMVFTLSLLAGCAAPAAAPAAPAAMPDTTTKESSIKIRLAHVCSADSPYDWGAQEFKKLVEEASNGRINVSVHAGDMTTDEIEAFEMAQSGNIEVAWVGTGSIGGFAPSLGVIGMPFLFEDNEHMLKAFNGEFGKTILEDVNKVDNVIGLGFHIDGWRNILSKGKVINSVADMKGLRIRSMMNNVNTSMYKALGAVPISIASGEIYTSLQTNVVEAQDNSFVYAVPEGYVDVVDSAAIVHHFYSGGIILANKNWFSGLSAEDQKLVQDCAVKAGAAAINKFQSEDEKLIEQYKAKGYTITYPSDIDAWKTAIQPVYEEQYKEHPDWNDLVKMVESSK